MKDFIIKRNKRSEADDFTMEHECDFCERYASQVIVLPESKYAMKAEYQKDDPFQICSTCLHEMQEALAKSIRDNFEKDFQNSRANFKFPINKDKDEISQSHYGWFDIPHKR